MRFLLLLCLLNNRLVPYTTTRYEGTTGQTAEWDCGPAAAATILHLAGFSSRPWPEEKKDVSLGQLARYLEAHGLLTEGYQLNWQQLLHFFTHFPNRPLIAHLRGETGHFVVLLGLVQENLLIADPALGVAAVSKKDFLQNFSGYTLYFPQLAELPGVKKLLAGADRRLKLLRLGVPY
ncbi:MAG TPA: hypothetical protein GX528_07635 [Firmicutes bacterium]|nr:hypothetical protein [Bacillota bacterium]